MEGDSSRGGAVMARGGRHGDQRRLDDFMHDAEGWGNAEGRPLSAEQMEAEDEMSASEEDDPEEPVREQGGAAGAATGPSSSSAHKPGQRLRPHQYGENSPTRASKQTRLPSEHWSVIKRLKDRALMGIDDESEDFDTHLAKRTHVCIVCWTLLKMGWDKKRNVWITDPIKQHFLKSPTCAPAEAARLRDKGRAKQTKLVGNMMQSVAESCGPGVQNTFALSSEERALTKVMRWYIYGKSRVHKTTFQDPLFREMLQGLTRSRSCA